MNEILTAVFAAVAAICAIGWLSRYISCAAMLWYMDKKGIPLPSREDMKEGCRWAAEHMFRDLTAKKGGANHD